MMMNNSFLKLTKDEEWGKLFEKRLTAFALLWLIARRAKRTNDHPDITLEIGEAYIGDYESYGVTEQIYRSDKKFLEKHKIVTFRATNKGTIARVVNTLPIDINNEQPNEQPNRQPTDNQRTTNEQLTTNKNDKNDKKEKKEKGGAGGNRLGESFDSQKASLEEDKDDKVVTPAVNTFGEKPQYPLNGQQITDACQPLPHLLPWIRYWHKRYDIDQEVLTFELEKIAIWMEKKDANSIGEPFLDSWMAKIPNHKKFGKQILKDEFVGSVPYTEFTNDGKLAIHATHKIREGSSGKAYYRQHYYFTNDEWRLILANNKK